MATKSSIRGIEGMLAVARPEHVFVAFDRNGTLVMLGNHSELTTISVQSLPSPDGDALHPGPGMIAPYSALVSRRGGDSVELARGETATMMELRAHIARDVVAGLHRPRGHRRGLMMTVCGLLGLLAGVACTVGLMPVPVQPIYPPGLAAGMPTGLRMPPGMPGGFAPPDLNQQLRDTNQPDTRPLQADPRVSHPAHPVSLDDIGATPPQAATTRPAISTGAPVARDSTVQAVPGVSPLWPSPAAQPSPATEPLPATPSPAPSATPPASKPVAEPAATSAQPPLASSLAPGAPPASAQQAPTQDPELARRQLAALNAVKKAISEHGPITQAMLHDLPPTIAARIMALPHTQALSSSAVAAAGVDPNGVPLVPDHIDWMGRQEPLLSPVGGGQGQDSSDLSHYGLPTAH